MPEAELHDCSWQDPTLIEPNMEANTNGAPHAAHAVEHVEVRFTRATSGAPAQLGVQTDSVATSLLAACDGIEMIIIVTIHAAAAAGNNMMRAVLEGGERTGQSGRETTVR